MCGPRTRCVGARVAVSVSQCPGGHGNALGKSLYVVVPHEAPPVVAGRALDDGALVGHGAADVGDEHAVEAEGDFHVRRSLRGSGHVFTPSLHG